MPIATGSFSHIFLGAVVVSLIFLVAVSPAPAPEKTQNLSEPTTVTFKIHIKCETGKLWCYKVYLHKKDPNEEKLITHTHQCSGAIQVTRIMKLEFSFFRWFLNSAAKIDAYVLHNCTNDNNENPMRSFKWRMDSIDSHIETYTQNHSVDLLNIGYGYRGTFEQADDESTKNIED